MTPKINPTFTKNNQLRIDISNHDLNHGEFKLCFSLVYAIISIDGAEIAKQVGRYYELHTLNNSILLTYKNLGSVVIIYPVDLKEFLLLLKKINL